MLIKSNWLKLCLFAFCGLSGLVLLMSHFYPSLLVLLVLLLLLLLVIAFL